MKAALKAAMPAEPEPAPDPCCFVFGGVALEVCPAPGMRWELSDEHRLFRGDYAASPVAGQVHCVLTAAPELEAGFTREIAWEWDDDVARVRTGHVRAELRRLAPGRYAATARVVPNDQGYGALCTALSAAIVSRERGLVLHAAGIELDGEAVLFIGPSGAGKTTTANLCDGSAWIARDRAAIYPTPLGWYAAGMAGGDPIDLPRSASRLLPLAGVYRIHQGGPQARTEVRALDLAEALAVVRESVQSVAGLADEGHRLESVLALAADKPVGALTVKLGESPVALLRSRP